MAIGWMTSAAVCYLLCGLVEANAGSIQQYEVAENSKLPLLFLGHHFLLFSLLNYARHVVREAMGIAEPAKAKSDKSETKAKAKPERASKVESKSKSNAGASEPIEKTTKTKVKKPKAPEPEEIEEPSAENDSPSSMKVVSDEGELEVDISKLSKSERRRLRREQRRSGKKAA